LALVSKKILIAVPVIIVAVAVTGIFVWRFMESSFAEVQDVIESFISALNDYDADACWSLMSPNLRSSYGTKGDFNSSILDGLRQSSWHAELAGISSKSIETKSGRTTAKFIVSLEISESDFGQYTDTYTFDLVKIEGKWLIENWRVGVWD